MARPTNESLFVKTVREAGGKVGNGQLLKALGWKSDAYWKVHADLFNSGLIVKGRGQGGSVILVAPETEDAAKQSVKSLAASDTDAVSQELVKAAEQASLQPKARESDLYEPALRQLKAHWIQHKQLLSCACEITARSGSQETGGSWSRPDLVAIGQKTFEYLPDKVLEVYTFELKADWDVSIKGVLEALAHREQATRSYVVYHTNGKSWDDFPEAQRIEQVATRHGVGVIVASQIDKFRECWDERVAATRSNSDPDLIDRFIKSNLSDDVKSQVRRWK